MFALLAVGGPRSAGSAVAIPDELAGYSYLTADVSNAPPGRVLAVYQHGFGVEFMDFPQGVVLAADADVYRRLDAAENRAGRESQGDPGPMLLSPDGASVALGDHDTNSPELEFVNLETGEVSRQRVPDARSVLPLAWSADGSEVAYVANDRSTNPHSGRPVAGDLLVLDLASGEAAPVPGGAKVSAAAYSPDGTQVAIQRRDAGPAVVDLDTETVRELPDAGRLTSPGAWSPDGQLLAVRVPSGVAAVNLGTSAAEATQLQLPRRSTVEVLGWTQERELAIFDFTSEHQAEVVALPLDGADPRQLTQIDGTSNYGVYRFQLATGLIADLSVRDAGEADRGPVPFGYSGVLALLCGWVAFGGTTWIARRLDRGPLPGAGPDGDPGAGTGSDPEGPSGTSPSVKRQPVSV